MTAKKQTAGQDAQPNTEGLTEQAKAQLDAPNPAHTNTPAHEPNDEANRVNPGSDAMVEVIGGGAEQPRVAGKEA